MRTLKISRDDALKMCSLTSDQIKIVETSNLKSHRDYNPRRGIKVARVINEYFSEDMFRGKRILEFGPGHYAFSLIARSLGAEVECVELDKALANLGRSLGFKVYEENFDKISGIGLEGNFDGIWQKGCFNACRFPEETDMELYVKEMTSLIGDGCWGWVSTCNKGSGHLRDDQNFLENRIKLQQLLMEKYGWDIRPFDDSVGSKYAIKYANSPVLFTKNLGIGPLI